MSKTLHQLARGLEKLADVHLLRRSSGPFWPEANFERSLHDYLKTDCIFDVGANIGQFGQNVREVVGYKGTILSFEPNPTAFERLSDYAGDDPNWHCYPFALGESAGIAKFNVMKFDNLSSLLEPGGESERYFADSNQIVETRDVDVRTLNDVFPALRDEFRFERPYLKLDTQGFDLHVARGGAQTIGAFTGCVSEVSLVPIYEGQPTMADSVACFKSLGLELVELFNVHPGGWFQPLIECNAFFLNQRFAQPLESAKGYHSIAYEDGQ